MTAERAHTCLEHVQALINRLRCVGQRHEEGEDDGKEARSHHLWVYCGDPKSGMMKISHESFTAGLVDEHSESYYVSCGDPKFGMDK